MVSFISIIRVGKIIMPNMTIKANISFQVLIGGTDLPVLLQRPVGVISGPSVLPGVSIVKTSWWLRATGFLLSH